MSALLRAWLTASRLPSQLYLMLPLLLGQLLAWRATGELNPWVFLLVQAFGVFDQLYIVYANDVADEATDRDNTTATAFSGGSRVLVEGRLTSASLARAAWVMAVLAVTSAALIGVLTGHWLPLPLALLGIGLLWAYSYPPLRLSYRGGGELLQTLGLGAVLPLLAFAAQAGELAGFPWLLLPVLLLLNLATAVTTALPDAPSDARANKRTLVVIYGLAPARRFILVLAAGALVLHALFVHDAHGPAGIAVPWLLAIPGVALMAAAVLHGKAEPGSRRLEMFVFLMILVNVAYLAGWIWLLLPWV